MFAAVIRKRRVHHRSYSQRRWHLDKRAPRTREDKTMNYAITLQKFAAVHASIHSHFNQDRHLNQPDIFKHNHAITLAEWRQLAA
jgi:hypothetical protein